MVKSAHMSGCLTEWAPATALEYVFRLFSENITLCKYILFHDSCKFDYRMANTKSLSHSYMFEFQIQTVGDTFLYVIL